MTDSCFALLLQVKTNINRYKVLYLTYSLLGNIDTINEIHLMLL